MDEYLQQANILTPIQEYDGVLYKRDDLFMPFPGEMLNGGKVNPEISTLGCSENWEGLESDFTLILNDRSSGELTLDNNFHEG